VGTLRVVVRDADQEFRVAAAAAAAVVVATRETTATVEMGVACRGKVATMDQGDMEVEDTSNRREGVVSE
jgi:uncharacterized protein (UPF0179 family)